ncbi:dienelactone hydrolase family protein [Azorhizobium sp. AG788]|uniref:dienelactone hydrolase family protein n=1 Tax=Azorhizobium sp. AG788 TaxID=2183897 RepID=UPI003138EB65
MINIITDDGQSISAYRADPQGTPKGAVVVIQELFGVDAHIRKVADAFAAHGYVAIAPALFDRVEPGVQISADEEGFAAGVALVEQIGLDRTLADIQAAVDVGRAVGKVAVVGFSWGGYLAYVGANHLRDVACVIGYYAAGVVGEAGAKRRLPTLLHFAENDPLMPAELVGQFRESRPDVSAFTYAGATHGFTCEDRPTFQPQASALAFERTLFWVSQYVEGQGPIALKNSGNYAQAKPEKKKSKKPEGDDLGPPL